MKKCLMVFMCLLIVFAMTSCGYAIDKPEEVKVEVTYRMMPAYRADIELDFENMTVDEAENMKARIVAFFPEARVSLALFERGTKKVIKKERNSVSILSWGRE